MKSKFMYHFIIIFTIFVLVGNLAFLLISPSLTKPDYTMPLHGGIATYSAPIYPILKTDQVILIASVLLINMALFGYFLFCFVTDRIKVSKILGIILYGLLTISLLIRFKIFTALLPLIIVGYLLNIKINTKKL